MSSSNPPPGDAAKIPSPFTTALLVTTILFVVLATLAVALRLYAGRRLTKFEIKTPDIWLIIAALLFCYGFMIQTICASALVGLNYLRTDLPPSITASRALQIYFTDILLTVPASGLVKISVLEFYKKIFVHRNTQIVCNIMIALCSIWIIGAFFGQIASTTPVSSAWDPALQMVDANYPYPNFALAIFGISIVLDVMVLLIPLRPISKLQMRRSKKGKIYGIFLLGAFCVICAAVRMYYATVELSTVYALTDAEKVDITSNSALWSRLEPSASIIAACLPTYGTLFGPDQGLRDMLRSAASFLSLRSNKSSSSTKTPMEYKYEQTRYKSTANGEWHELHQEGTLQGNVVQARSNESSRGMADPHNITVTHEYGVQ